MKRVRLFNLVLLVSVLLLMLFAIEDFLYILLVNHSNKPEFTGTASDIIIAATNSALVCIAIMAYRKFFKERIYEKAVDKIDSLLINLDASISEIDGIFIELIRINVYFTAGDFTSNEFSEYLKSYMGKLQKGMEHSYLAKTNSSTLNRWRVKNNPVNESKLKNLLDESFELHMMLTTIYIALTDCISEANGHKKIQPDADFSKLFPQFQKRRMALIELHEELKSIPADELFSLY